MTSNTVCGSVEAVFSQGVYVSPVSSIRLQANVVSSLASSVVSCLFALRFMSAMVLDTFRTVIHHPHHPPDGPAVFFAFPPIVER